MLQLERLGPVPQVKGWGDGCELLSGVLKMRVMRAGGARHRLWEACGDRALLGDSADLSSLVWVPPWFRWHTHQAVQTATSRCLWGHDAGQAGLEPPVGLGWTDTKGKPGRAGGGGGVSGGGCCAPLATWSQTGTPSGALEAGVCPPGGEGPGAPGSSMAPRWRACKGDWPRAALKELEGGHPGEHLPSWESPWMLPWGAEPAGCP